jgi:hypothetical protein
VLKKLQARSDFEGCFRGLAYFLGNLELKKKLAPQE